MAKILVVDDEADLEVLIKQKFRKKIRSNEYEFIFAKDGLEALEKVKNNENIDIVLSDINMPRMDGLTLLRHLKDEVPLVRTVIVSAYGDMENIRTAMNCGAFDFITKPILFDDLTITMEKTLAYVNQIRSTLKAIKENNILKMYVDESVLNFMSTQNYEEKIKANETIEATVMFIDICGFTAISERESPDTVVSLLNKYFDIMVNTIVENDGYIDKFIGDAVMAVFKDDHHLDHAVEAALEVRNQINNIPDSADINAFKSQVSIGIASGEVICGNIGAASLKRLDYTVIGDVVNTASRLQDIGKPNQIIITEHCYLSIKESFECKKLFEAQLKNKKETLNVYEVIS